MATIDRFDPPGNETDFDSIPNQKAGWDEFIESTFESEIQAVQSDVPKSQFYNPKKTSSIAPIATNVISWIGFPRLIDIRHPGDKRAAWIDAEKPTAQNERPQDEYLEWFVTRDDNMKVTRIDFTCEGPEYWEALAHGYPRNYTGPKLAKAKGDTNVLLALYRRFISSQVELADLVDSSGQYNRHNKWNTTHGAMHLNQRNNTLGAEINIAAQATIKRIRNGQLLTDAEELINCAGFGAAGRASDPHIGEEVNALARQGFSITLQNPVGLYIAGPPDFSGWATPDGTDASTFWKVTRGTDDMILRATLEVPSNLNYKLGDVEIDNAKIEFGGQIADLLKVKLTGIAFAKGGINNNPVACDGAVPFAVAAGPARPTRRP